MLLLFRFEDDDDELAVVEGGAVDVVGEEEELVVVEVVGIADVVVVWAATSSLTESAAMKIRSRMVHKTVDDDECIVFLSRSKRCISKVVLF